MQSPTLPAAPQGPPPPFVPRAEIPSLFAETFSLLQLWVYLLLRRVKPPLDHVPCCYLAVTCPSSPPEQRGPPPPLTVVLVQDTKLDALAHVPPPSKGIIPILLFFVITNNSQCVSPLAVSTRPPPFSPPRRGQLSLPSFPTSDFLKVRSLSLRAAFSSCGVGARPLSPPNGEPVLQPTFLFLLPRDLVLPKVPFVTCP